MSVRIFISCVTGEFKGLRDQLGRALRAAGHQVDIQEEFAEQGRPTLAKLDAIIEQVDVVLHLVGHQRGAMPRPVVLEDFLRGLERTGSSLLESAGEHIRGRVLDDPSRFSYTEWEALLALHREVRLLVFEIRDIDEVLPAPQKDHLALLEATGLYPQQVPLSRVEPEALISATRIRDELEAGIERRSPPHLELTHEIARYCRFRFGPLLVEPRVRSEGGAFQIKRDDGTPGLVVCTEGRVTSEVMDEAVAQAEAAQVRHCRVVTSASYTPYLHRPDVGAVRVEVSTVAQFLVVLLQVQDDLDRVERHCVDEGIAQGEALDRRRGSVKTRYVDTSCYQVTADRKGVAIGRIQHASMIGHTRRWLTQEGPSKLAVLGDYGTGKTWFTLKLCYELIQSLKADTENIRLPILVRLGEREAMLKEHEGLGTKVDPSELDLVQLLSDMLVDGIEDGPALITSLLTNGRLLLVLDGFDELGTALTIEQVRTNLETIDKLAQGDSKLILTSRTAYFNSARSEATVLGSSFDIVHLAELSAPQILAYLTYDHGHRADELLDQIEATYDLQSLAKRPVLLKIISENVSLLDAAARGEAVHLSDVYAMTIDTWVRDAGAGDRGQLNELQRASLMKSLAWRLYQDGSPPVESKELGLLADELCMDDLEGVDSASIEHDLRMCSFLRRDGRGRFSFAHRSFMEFFVAGKFRGELEQGSLHDFGSQRMTEAVVSFLMDRPVAASTLHELLDKSRQGEFPKWTTGNLIWLLRRSGATFEGIDLSGATLLDVNLSNLELAGARFQGARLRSVNLSSANLEGADFSGADLHDLILGVKSSAKAVDCSPVGPLYATANAENEVLLSSFDPKQAPVTLGRLDDSMTNVRFSPDGSTLAAVGFDGYLRLWDVPTRRLLRAWRAHPGTVYGLVFVQRAGVPVKSSLILTSGTDGLVRAWLVDDQTEAVSFDHHSALVYKMEYHPGADIIATASFQGTIGLLHLNPSAVGLQVDRQQMLGEAEGHRVQVNDVAFSPDGVQIASVGNDGTLRLWHCDSGRLRRTYQIHDAPAWSVVFTPDGEHLVTGSTDHTVAVVRARDGTVVRSLRHHSGTVWSVDIDHSGKLIVSGARDGTAKAVAWENGSLLQSTDCGHVSPHLRCRGMILSHATGLSLLQKETLFELGAIE